VDKLDLKVNTDLRTYFVGLQRPCPSNMCQGFLTEFDQEGWEPFKAFLMCPKCESRLRVYKRK
jgi:hypothetical protein